MINEKDAELAVIGSCLCDVESLKTALGIVSPENFKDQRAAIVFERMTKELADGRPVDVVTITDSWKHDSELSKWIWDCVNMVPSALNVRYYADIVYHASIERRMVTAAMKVQEDPSNEAYKESLRQALFASVKSNSHVYDMEQASKLYLEELDNRSNGSAKSHRTGIPGLDNMLTSDGFCPGQFVVVGARPGMGKSALLEQWAVKFAQDGKKVLYFSAEMNAVELMDRMVSARSGVPIKILGSKRWEEHSKRICAVVQQNARLPITLDIMGIFELHKVLADIDAYSPDIVILDYVQLFHIPQSRGDNSRYNFFTQISNTLKSIAGKKGIVVIGACQLNRNIEMRPDKEPQLSDLRETGAFEQDASIIIFPFFPEKPNEKNIRTGSLIVAKQRNGAVGKVPVMFYGDTTEFREIEKTEENNF